MARVRQPQAQPAQPRSSEGGAAYDEVSPALSVRTSQAEPYPRHAPSPPFWLVYVPDRWRVVEGLVVPDWTRLRHAVSVNGVDGGPGKALDTSYAEAQQVRQGRQILPWDVDGRSYLRRYRVGTALDARTRTEVPQYTWVTRWDTLYPGSDRVEHDALGHAQWSRHLIADGIIPPPRPYVISHLRGRYETLHQQSASKWGATAARTVGYARALEAIAAELAALHTRLEPAAAEDMVPEAAT